MIVAECAICGKDVDHEEWVIDENSKIVHWSCLKKNAVVELKPWETVEFPWGTAVRKRRGEWTNLYLKPTGHEINLEEMGIKVILHDNGIEFIGG